MGCRKPKQRIAALGIPRASADDGRKLNAVAAIVPVISTLDSVQSYEGELQLLFRSAVAESGSVEVLAEYDAKTGQRLPE